MAYGNCKQGVFIPKNKEKYKGDWKKIIYRSSWEETLMKRLDRDSETLEWSSEEIIIPYIYPPTGTIRRYFMDFWVKTTKGEFLIEVKPFAQTIPPKKKKDKRKFLAEMTTYSVNQSKWNSARNYAKKHDMKFVIFTENELGIAGHKKLKRTPGMKGVGSFKKK